MDALKVLTSSASTTSKSSTSNKTATTTTDPMHIQTKSNSQQKFEYFWPIVRQEINQMDGLELGIQVLPLARIKKVIKMDPEVGLVSNEVMMLLAKAVEIFIHELTLCAWLQTERDKRVTMQRYDIALATADHDHFDFLIDIVPRDVAKRCSTKKKIENCNVESSNELNGSIGNVFGHTRNSSNSPQDNRHGWQLVKIEPAVLQHSNKARAAVLPDGNGKVYHFASAVESFDDQQKFPVSTTSIMQTANIIPPSKQQHAGTQIYTVQQQQPISQTMVQAVNGQSTILANGSKMLSTHCNTTSNVQFEPVSVLEQVILPTDEITRIPITMPLNQLNIIQTSGANFVSNNDQPIFIQTVPMHTGHTIIHSDSPAVFLSANHLHPQQPQLQYQSQLQHQQQIHDHGLSLVLQQL